ncbi:hypothetical protein WMY93_027542 [Mugilogobius chulae]|uniref:Integrase catalytic domain-containing protein n=1 Tax=Mugilogobius chulae TaxID=88201 RepID=A0AAW0N5I9_9GOBI
MSSGVSSSRLTSLECGKDETKDMSREDLQFLDIATQSSTLVDGHYSIALPLRSKDVQMPNNRKVAEQRALNLKQKFVKNPSFHAEYSAFMSNIIEKGYAVKVPDKDLSRDDGKVWYLPHHGVYHPKKHTLRVVFDCGVSYQGTTFRQEEVALMADVEAMFHQVKVPDEDSDLLRFLWWKSGDITQEMVEYKMVVHLFGATSSPSCASFALRKCAEDNRDQFNKQAVDTVLHNFYVDDCLKMVLSAIPEEERAAEVKDIDLDRDSLPMERALGVHWCIQSDSFQFRIMLSDKTPTRRNILSLVSSVYDPLGILSPVTLQAKKILQELCRRKIGWDVIIPDDLAHECEEGYGTVSYLVQKNSSNQVHCSFVLGKARVAPLKPMTVPRMELTAATMAARMDEVLRSEIHLPLQTSAFWSDSTTVLKYIHNTTSRFRTFVANRVDVILKCSNPNQWRYINTSQNPADFASRGLKAENFIQTHVWLQGPAFLCEPIELWPENKQQLGDLTTEDPEIKNTLVCANAVEETGDVIQEFLQYFSSWFRLKKAVAWILKVRSTLLELCRKRILRVGGRLSRAALPEESKRPAILNKDHYVTKLIIREVHENLAHGGRNHVLSKLRTKYWIPSANTAIRHILSKCIVCRRKHGVAGQQQMADLPRDRVLPDDPPFTNTGVDYFGPFEVKRGRSMVKRYGVIFTCLTVRAVHLEMASSLDTDSFIHALRRFIARRGQVKILRSDNGTNFIGAERELKKAIQEWNVSKIEDSLQQHGIQWMFNPPSGSHHGGVWERLIKSVKKILNTTVNLQTLDEEGLHTLLCEAEAIVNSRPITKASSDPNDLEMLTPNHLLLLKTKPSLPPGLFDKQDLYARRRWKQIQYMSDIFWKRWTREYLPLLQERQKWARPSRNFAIGDIVLIVDDSSPRNSWVTGKVVQTTPDKSGFVRQVRVKTKTTTLDRPITKICLLQEVD